MAIRREIGQRMTATVPRMLAVILDETSVAGMAVLLHRCRSEVSELQLDLYRRNSAKLSRPYA
jgi:hypothetical protein